MSESKGTILIVEDEVIIAEDIRKTLTRFNYEVLEIVTFGEIAIQRAEELRIHNAVDIGLTPAAVFWTSPDDAH